MKTLRVIAFLFFLAAALARAGLTMALTASVQNSVRGKEVVFHGTLTNTSGTGAVFLNDIAFALSGASATNLTPEPNSFFANVPGILQPGESYTSDEIFRVMLNVSAPAGDYGGTVSVFGGADMLGTGNLASTAFTILSPEVSLVATDASAAEQGPDTGAFTIMRTGGTGIDLPVTIGIGGTAGNGAAYQAIGSGVTIPAGSSSAMITITPIPNDIAEGDRTVVLTLAAADTYNLGSLLADTVTIHDKPADNWRFLKFGAQANTPAAADTADFAGDGIVNLIKYALDLNPFVSETGSLPQPILSIGYLTLSYVPNSAATDLTYAIESSTDLLTWGTSDVEDITAANPNPPGLRTFRYKYTVSPTGRVFLRLHLTRN